MRMIEPFMDDIFLFDILKSYIIVLLLFKKIKNYKRGGDGLRGLNNS